MNLQGGSHRFKIVKPSEQDLKALSIQQVKQFQRGAAGLLAADFPLPYRGQTGVEYRREHGLAEVVTVAQSADVFAGVGRHRR